VQQGNEVSVIVSDNGPGIAPDELPLVFEKYRQATQKRQRPGSGLGLFIVKALVEAHGGRVTVESQPGVRTAFSVMLPLVPSLLL
jgi:two-component system, OmpR family, sensor histidine kinase BaeS